MEPITGGIVGDGEVAVDGHHLQPLDCVARLGLGSLGQLGRGRRPLGQRVQPAQAVTEVQVEGLRGTESGGEDLVSECGAQLLAPLAADRARDPQRDPGFVVVIRFLSAPARQASRVW